ncbi:MAG TPA: protein kinase, partial [Thermoanaerobaculia bacterium]|nr:protein kinase [Thermoanaerobaculia bacterium]
MGEVFLAQDTRLGRKVALKLLPEGLLSDKEIRRRFAQEARTASALNHPNIVTIYDIGSADGRDFLAMEYVEGQSLRDVLEAGQLDVRRALDLTAQAASALAAAHEAGIVHRDIKPENLIVNRGGQLKILDFGLAKLVERQTAPLLASSLETLAETPQPTSQGRTGTGVILGTVSYMSPEQARGQPVDHRTDIFSLGLVLYEALTGSRPFSGKSAVETLHAIINEEPVSAIERNPRVPLEAVDILGKALAKDPAERYQHAADFALDLRRARRVFESGISRPGLPVAPAQAPRPRPLLWAVGAVAAAALVAGAWYVGRSGARPAGPNLADVTLTPLTNDPGYEGEPTFSADGETIAYVSDRTGNFEIFLKQVSGGPDVNVTNSPADDVQPAFSPDGKQIAFVSTRQSLRDLRYENFGVPATGGDIWVMPALGGNARRIAQSGNFPSWSSDGSSIVYMAGGDFNKKIYRVPAAGGEAKEIPIQHASGPGRGGGRYLLYPSLSPDGRWLLFQTTGGAFVVGSGGGEAKHLGNGRRPVWAPDGRSIVYSTGEAGKNSSLWKLPFSTTKGTAEGRGEPLTVGIAPNTQASIAGDGKQIVFTALEQTFNLETIPLDAEAGRVTGEVKELTAGRNDIQFKTFSPDGRSVVYGKDGRIWRLDAGQPAYPLTDDPAFDDGAAQWSPDGRSIVFTRAPAGEPRQPALWMMASDGAGPRLLVEKARVPSWTPDSRGVVHLSTADDYLYLYDIATGRKRRVSGEPTLAPLNIVSPDGKWVIYQSSAEADISIRAHSIEGGETRVVVSEPGQGLMHPLVSPSGNWFYYQPNHKNLYRIPGPAQGWRKAEPQKVTNFPESGLFIEDPRLSMDGKQLIYSRGKIIGDLWLYRFPK